MLFGQPNLVSRRPLAAPGLRTPPCRSRWRCARLAAAAAAAAAQPAVPLAAVEPHPVALLRGAAGLDRVAALLAYHGLDPARLERRQPEAFSRLTLPLAEVLAEMHSARVSSARDLLTQPAAFVHRICELSQAVGLSPADICELWLSDPAAMRANIVPRPAAAAPQPADAPAPAEAALPAAVQQASPQQPAPQLPHRNSAAQQRDIQKLLGISHGEWAAALAADPGLDAAPPAIVAGVVEWLRSAPLGFSLGDVRKLWLSQPRLFCQPAEALQQGLLGKADFLLQYGFTPEELSRVVAKAPTVLTASLEAGIQPVLAALEGVAGGRKAVQRAVRAHPALLAMAPGSVAESVAALQALGLSERDVRQALRRVPQYFAAGAACPELRAKLRYFHEVLGRPPRQMLAQAPHFLRPSLADVDRKVAFLEHKGAANEMRSLRWVPWSDESFCAELGLDLAEFRGAEWEARWLATPRAREYALSAAAPISTAAAVAATSAVLASSAAAVAATSAAPVATAAAAAPPAAKPKRRGGRGKGSPARHH